MSVLILNVGGSQVDVPYVSAQEGQPVYVGDVSDSANGTERNSIRAAKRAFTVTTTYLDATTEASVRAAIGNMAQIPCAGDLFNNSSASVTCSVALTSRTLIAGIAPYVFQLVLALKFVAAT